MTSRAPIASIAVTAALAFAAPVFAADVVVVDSSVSAIPPGEVIAEEVVVTIPVSTSLALIMPNGETRIVDGPYTGPIGDAQADAGSSLQALSSGRGGETKVLGAVRAPAWELTD